MTVSIGLIVEITVNLIQQILFIGFLYLFFEKGENKVKNYLAFTISILLLFMMENYYTFHEMTFNHLDSLITVIVMILYALIFLKGELYLRIIMPLVCYGLNMIIAFATISLMGAITGKTLAESVEFSTAFRYIYLIVVETVYIIMLWLILRIRKKKIVINSPYDVFSFIAIPILCMVAMYTDVFIYQIVDFDSRILVLVIINLLVLIVISVLIWFLLMKVSKDNQVKTELLLSKQREEMYKSSVLSANKSIEKISQIKHDIRNNAMTVSSLIKNEEYGKAQSICDSIEKNLSGATPIHTLNPVLNAILNVEIEKANSQSIIFTYEINDTLSFIEDIDIVSLIGNLCDNAIEYLITIKDPSLRKMSLSIALYKNFYYISCKNTIIGSVLSDNPNMNTTKRDNDLHGKGLAVLQRIAKTYRGGVRIKEENQEIIISVIVRDRN